MEELFRLIGKVIIENDEANKKIDETAEKAEKSESKLSVIGNKIKSGLAAAAKAGAVAIAGMATVAATGFVALSTQAVQCYADYEQLVGGVETLFGAGGQSIDEYAKSVGISVDEASDKYQDLMSAQDAVIRHADEAYKTAGLSANAYMETVTSFSAALISSLDGDTVKAASVADKAIVDMADNANKMGSSMESIQNAYQGFAKQNYTMLDNLKLGYGGTKEEMQRLLDDAGKLANQKFDLSSYADIVEAIHVVQTNMGITGTTAKEAATTIQGSIGMMKAAWTNFLTGMADPDQNFDALLGNLVDSVVTVTDNLIPRISALLPRLVAGLSQVAQNLAGYLPDIVQQLLPALLNGVTALTGELITAIPATLQTVIPVVVDALENIFDYLDSSTGFDFSGLFDGLVNGATQVGEMLKGVIPSIVSAIQQVSSAIAPLVSQLVLELLPPLLQIGQTILPLITLLLDPIIVIIQGLMVAVSPLLSILGSIITQVESSLIPVVEKLSTFITTLLVPTIQNIMTVVQEVVIWVTNFVQENLTTIQAIIQSAFDIISGIVDFFIAMFKGDWEGVWSAVQQILQAGYDFFVNIFNLLLSVGSSILSALHDAVVNIFENIRNAILDKISAALNFVIEKFNALPAPIKNALSIVLGFVVTCVQSIIEKVQTTYNNIQAIFNVLKDFVSSVMNTIWSTISSKLESIKVTFTTKLTAVVDGVNEKFQAILAGIKEKMEAAKSAVSEAIEKIKSFFDFEWHLPELKLPHIKINGEWDLKEGKFPSFDVEWYADGAVLNKPTIFGMNGNRPMIGGEAGAEAIAPIDVLQEYVSEAVASQNAGLIEILEKILIAILSLNDDMKDSFIEAVAGMKLNVNNREFARIVKAVY